MTKMAAGSSKESQRTISKATFDTYNVDLQKASLDVLKQAMSLPGDIEYYRSVDADITNALDACSNKVLKLTNVLLELIVSGSTSVASSSRKQLETHDDVTDRFGSVIVDAVDSLLERADICLDAFSGRSKPAAIDIKMSEKTSSRKRGGPLDPALAHASNIPKPQLKFKKPIDNSPNNIWRPSLQHKYNAQIPVGYNFHAEGDVDTDMSRIMHPYRYEIKHISYPAHMLKYADPIAPRSFEDTPFRWIETESGLNSMIEKLKLCTEIAIDLEHHSYRTYSGFLCLMQISTREEDFIVDTLILRDELEKLNEVFTDPKITKVLHGAESDVVWLQQDFHLYIVNLFDTYHASRALNFPRHGLSALLSMYCDFMADKRYQLADWRIRPLPQEMLDYARSDTHFLLYIYDNLRNALLDRCGGDALLLRTVLGQSEETALRVYASEMYDMETGSGASGWGTLATKWNKALSGQQMNIFKALHAWRDRVAREEDESTRYVLPNHYLFQLAERPPTDVAAVLNSFRAIPPLIRTRAQELLSVIRTSAVGDPAAVTEHDVKEKSVEVIEIAVKEAVAPAETMADQSGTELWYLLPRSAAQNFVASSSTLFQTQDTSMSMRRLPTSSLLTTKSALFMPSNMFSAGSRKKCSRRYMNTIARVHRALLADATPNHLIHTKATTPPVHVEAETPDIIKFDSIVPEQIEIPFVPSSQRRLAVAPVSDDTIVVVGKPKAKKRKRALRDADDDQSKESTPAVSTTLTEETTVGDESRRKDKKKARKKMKKGKGGNDVEDDEGAGDMVEPFDYSKSSNMLDDQPVEEAQAIGTLRKQPRATKAPSMKIDYGNFGRVRDPASFVKGGNVSRSFRSTA